MNSKAGVQIMKRPFSSFKIGFDAELKVNNRKDIFFDALEFY
jgi:hypothetical protein